MIFQHRSQHGVRPSSGAAAFTARKMLRPRAGALRRSQQGSILLVTLVICSMVGIMLACYLKMVGSQTTYTFRSQIWNSAIPVCEAGVEEAMAHLNALGTNTSFAINGWVKETDGYVKERTLLDGSYRAIIDTNFPPVITVQGKLQAPFHADRYISRAVQVKTKWNRKFPRAIVAKSRIELGGSSSRIDSFISTNNAYSTGGQYDILKARDEAAVACLASTPGNFDIANTKIHGHIGTSPGGNYILGPGGAVGTTAWCLLNIGVQPARHQNDLNLYIPDVVFPSPFGPVFAPSSGTNGGIAYTYLLDSGDYRMSTLSLGAGQTMFVKGRVRLHVTGQIQVSSTGSIEIGTNGDLSIFAGGQVDIKGQGVVNRRGYAQHFSLNGLSTCTAIEYGGSSKFIGNVYAPQADVRMSGGAEAIGAIVADRFDFNGGFSFHYDECLQGRPETGRFLVDSWMEL